MMRFRVGCASVAFAALVAGCGDPNDDVTIAELKDEMAVDVYLLGTSSPPTARQLVFFLAPERTPGPAGSERCPVVAAKLTVNGVEAQMTSDGSFNDARSWVDGEEVFPGTHCTSIRYQLPVDDSLRATASAGVTIELTDQSGSFVMSSDDFISNPEAVMVAPESGKLRPGNLAAFTVTPPTFQVPDQLRASYVSQDPGNGFAMDVVEVRGNLFVLGVPENESPSRGRVSVQAVGGIHPLTMRASRCDFAECTIERSSCLHADSCNTPIAYDPGFDTFSIQAEVEAAR